MDILIAYALQFVGTAYRWGGDDAIQGYDCSGFIQELLASAGMDPHGDQTAQELFSLFEKGGQWNSYTPGALAFYGESAAKITHVAMLLDRYRVIEAGGGGYRTLTLADAVSQNAMVRVRHITHRKDLVAVIRPRYAPIGLL